jgi:hypothetical protein
MSLFPRGTCESVVVSVSVPLRNLGLRGRAPQFWESSTRASYFRASTPASRLSPSSSDTFCTTTRSRDSSSKRPLSRCRPSATSSGHRLGPLLALRSVSTIPSVSPSHATMASTNGTSHISFIGAIDQGTTSSRFLIFNASGEVVASHQLEFKQYYPRPG